MFRIDEYMDSLISALRGSFGKRLIYIGLQGSYLRHEEKQNSDIDIMTVVDGLSVKWLYFLYNGCYSNRPFQSKEDIYGQSKDRWDFFSNERTA